jgi:hypothetical protein
MVDRSSLPPDLSRALERGVLQRMPLTFLPFVNQQLHQWLFLFPNETQSVQRLLLYIDGLSSADSAALFREITQIEDKMEVRRWHLSMNEQTIQNSSELARSPYFQQWRVAVQSVFDVADKQAVSAQGVSRPMHRLILIDIPEALPLRRETAWRRWQGTGTPLDLDASLQEPSRNSMEFLLDGLEGHSGFLRALPGEDQAHAAVWILDAGRDLIDSVVQAESPAKSAKAARSKVLLSYQRLDTFRENFSHTMNSMRKDLSDADMVFDRLRDVDVTPWCPDEIVADPAVREFVRSLYLSGNGAVIFGNSFVEWGASEAFRRARPVVLAARFGVRAKPKPFTGVAVFDNPDRVNPGPSVDDRAGSAKDAEILAWYVWLAATRYPEYQSSTVCLCGAESIAQVYLVAPKEFELTTENGAVSLAHLQNALNKWVA